MNVQVRRFKVTYRSRYFPLEGKRVVMVSGKDATDIRARWHSIMETDEYRILKIEAL